MGEPPQDSQENLVPFRRNSLVGVPRVVHWGLNIAGTHALAVITICGLVVYGRLHLYYVQVFAPFDVRPEEIGLSWAQSLSDAVILMGALAIVLFVLWAVRFATNQLVCAGFAALIFIIGAVIVVRQVPTLQNDIRDGRPIHKDWLTNPLAVRASLGRIVWLASPPHGLKNLGRRQVLFLGAANGTMVIYDFKSHVVLRLATVDAVFDAKP